MQSRMVIRTRRGRVSTVSAFNQVITSSSLKEKGFAGFFVKPFYPLHLKTALQLTFSGQRRQMTLPLVTRHTISEQLFGRTQTKAVQADMFMGTRVLAVEDIKVNMMLLTRILEQHGCRVSPAWNGFEAIEMIKENDYDIVFMDCQMPEMDGFEATKAIRDYEGTDKHTAVIALTADAMTGDREKCLAAGMDDYLNKPFKQQQITDILRKWVRKQV